MASRMDCGPLTGDSSRSAREERGRLVALPVGYGSISMRFQIESVNGIGFTLLGVALLPRSRFDRRRGVILLVPSRSFV